MCEIGYGLTDRGNIIKFKVSKGLDEHDNTVISYIENVRVLDLESACFSLKYNKKKDGNVSVNSITEDPKELFNAINKTKMFFEKRELALMNNLFIVEDTSSEEILTEVSDEDDENDEDVDPNSDEKED